MEQRYQLSGTTLKTTRSAIGRRQKQILFFQVWFQIREHIFLNV